MQLDYSALVAFAKHVLREQLEHGAGGDAEYIRMAIDALKQAGEDGPI